MNESQEVIKFSLADEQLHFEIDGPAIDIKQGLNFIIAQSVRFGRIDALAIESMIDVIEQLLEKLKLDFHQQRTAQTTDQYMQRLSTLFLNDEKCIDRMMLEHAFNEFIESLEYYTEQVDHEFKLWVYFVLIREMMHHWNVSQINLLKRVIE